jgi:hypothetical protein
VDAITVRIMIYIFVSYRASRFTHLSVLYATMLVLFGFVFPMSEALLGEWLTNHLIGVSITGLMSHATVSMSGANVQL